MKAEKISFGSFLVGIYLFSVPVLSYTAKFGLMVVPQIVGALITLLAIYELLNTRTFNKNISLILYFLFTVWSVISYPYSEYQFNNEQLFTLIKVTIITVSAAYIIRNQTEFLFSLSIFFLSIFLTFSLNLEDILKLGNYNSLGATDRFAGTFANANTAALYSLAIIWVGFMLMFIKNPNFIIKLIIIAGIILAGFVVVLSGSRKGLLGLGFMTVAIAWVPVKKFGSTYFRKTLIAIILLVLIWSVFLIIYKSPYFLDCKRCSPVNPHLI